MSPSPQSERLVGRCLYLCTPDRPDLESFIGACIDGGVDVVQLREKYLEAKPLLARAALVQRLCASMDVPFILNDRPDLALACGADGVHVGQDDAPAALARSILGPDAIIGLSTHGHEDLVGAMDEPVDYISVGPVVPTPTKPGRPGTGISYLEDATTVTSQRAGGSLPYFVTGGVTPETLPKLLGAGATRFVVVRYLTESEDPKAAAKRLRRAIAQGVA